MGIIDTFAQLILYICYAAYCCVGLILLITTVMYLTEITGGNDFVTIGLGCSGLLMLIIGGVALYANFKQIWLILAVRVPRPALAPALCACFCLFRHVTTSCCMLSRPDRCSLIFGH